jgi:DnaJ-class molecular chaperone
MKDAAEIRCEACNGTGFPQVKQPKKPGRKIYPAPCRKCGGKGRVVVPQR